MIVDLHTHLVRYSEDFRPQLKRDLARCGIPAEKWDYNEEVYLAGTAAADRAVVFGIRGVKTGWDVKNTNVFEFVSRNPKYIFFTSIDPTEEDYLQQLEHDHKELGCRGVKLGPVYQGLHPHDPRYYKIYEYCEHHSLPIITHMATTFSSGVPLDYARPVHMDKVACDFPRLKVVLAHLGHPWIEECIAVVRHQENLYADISALYYRPWQFYNSMMSVAEYGAGAKILFGSDFPATTTSDSISGLRGVNRVAQAAGLPEVPVDMLEDILQRDSLGLLGITGGENA